MSGFRPLVAVLCACFWALIGPAAVQADVFTLGPPTVGYQPVNAACAGCSIFAQRSTTEVGALSSAPYDGTVTGWRVYDHEHTASGDYYLRILRPGPGTAFTAVGRSDKATFQSAEDVNPTNLPIKAGDLIGVEAVTTSPGVGGATISPANASDPGKILTFPAMADGAIASPQGELDGRLQLNATVTYTIPPPPPPDVTSPAVSFLTLSPSTFKPANIGGSLIAASVGTTVVYELSEPSTVKFTVQKPVAGRKVKSKGKTRCVKTTRKNRRKRHCTRYVTLKGSFTHSGKAGLNRFKFTGRLGGKALKRGKYRLVSVATDAAGNKSKSRTRSFRIVR